MVAASSPGRRRRPQLPEEVAAHLREQIMTGLLRQGDHLRLEYLADELGISVTPVREALLTLRGEGFVELAPRKGFLVAPLSRQDIEDTYRLRAMLAGELAARAARKITIGEISELESLHAELVHACQHREDTLIDELNVRFHQAINAIADSGKLTWFLGIAVRYAPRRLSGIGGWPEATAAEHRKILHALRNRDPVTAHREIHAHVMHSGRLLIEHLEARGFWSS